MGFNTTIMLHNDQMSRWPEEIRQAAQSWTRFDCRHRNLARDGGFSYGQVVAVEHADHPQVCVIGGNWGRYLTPTTAAEWPADLNALAEVLRGHGYSVRAPGEAKAKPPLRWGYAAKNPAPPESPRHE